MADDETGYQLSERFVYEGVDPTTGERFHFRANAGETRIPKNEREEQALKGAVALEVAEEVEITSSTDAKQGGSRKGALKPSSKPEATEAELASELSAEDESEDEESGETSETQETESEEPATAGSEEEK